MEPVPGERGFQVAPEDRAAAAEWVRRSFPDALLGPFRGPEGKVEFLLIESQRDNGFTKKRMIAVPDLAGILAAVVPDFRDRPPAEVKAKLRRWSEAHDYALEPLLDR